MRKHALMSQARRISLQAAEWQDWTDAKLRDELDQLRLRFRLGRDTPRDTHRALACLCNAAARTLGLQPVAEQVAAALAMQAGCVAEQATGEGKTLTAVLAAVPIAWRGYGCHVVTVNDYLAARDAATMGPCYTFCGLTVDSIVQESEPARRRQAYQADVTYCTNKEVSADFLRDRLAMDRRPNLTGVLLDRLSYEDSGGTDRLVQRGLYAAIVDEADSILIDEAVTPLILSGPAPNDQQVTAYRQASQLADSLQAQQDFRVDTQHHEVDLTSRGLDKLRCFGRDAGGVWKGLRRGEELLCQALTARHLYLRNTQYVVQDGEIVIVDGFTGRLMPDREWRNGLHQAIQAKEHLEIKPPKDTYARISFQRFFRLYHKLAGMTGTAAEAAGEFWATYRLPTVVFPTHAPCRRKEQPDRVYATRQEKWNAVLEETDRIRQTGAAVLVGTRSVAESETISGLLAKRGIRHEVLNAVRHQTEAQIVAQAGQPGAVTVATNMAGRGTDIKLGRGVAQAGGLHVMATERHESRRVDRQLFGRCGRQGDPGWARAFVSLEDDLPSRHAARLTALLARRYAGYKGAIPTVSTRYLFARAQRRAQCHAARQRAAVLRNDTWLDEQLAFAGREH